MSPWEVKPLKTHERDHSQYRENVFEAEACGWTKNLKTENDEHKREEDRNRFNALIQKKRLEAEEEKRKLIAEEEAKAMAEQQEALRRRNKQQAEEVAKAEKAAKKEMKKAIHAIDDSMAAEAQKMEENRLKLVAQASDLISLGSQSSGGGGGKS